MKEINTSVAIQILPNVKDGDELIRVVDEVIAYIKSKNLKTNVGPFETTIEGNYEELMEIVKECQYIAVKSGASGAMSYIKINYKPNGNLLTIDEKINKHK
ncbi:MAG: thiamine-binding protein [Fusobacterium gastrosuis]|uniref:thiamine-binding protein n=1 Tax=Fusobacterium gastrosuis TaxID=1755100 RepID=UPI002A8988B0|nr:thiamine-binding protein [Fusobacterium gastrosuis]